MSVSFPSNRKPISLPEIRSLWSVLEGSSEGQESSTLPAILIAANYDSFSAAPSLSRGFEDGGSGSIAVLSILRLFHRLYTEQNTVGKFSPFPPIMIRFNLAFLLSSGGHLDYEGYRQWMLKASPEFLASVQFVLCLEDLGWG
jgi:hypothetical protein